ncbi:MAG TPA: hypothetical protein ENK23_03510, partial [Sorangium sp.]|nr:hypothetical protein [Sorangium sp.]
MWWGWRSRGGGRVAAGRYGSGGGWLVNEPRRLHHLALGARDVARMASFYREVLGLAELRR